MSPKVKSKTVSKRIPAEWEKHRATVLGWPQNKEDWPGKFEPIPWVFAEIIKHIVPGEDVYLFVGSKAVQRKVTDVLQRAHVDTTQVHFVIEPTDRGWMRDAAPAYVYNRDTLEAVRFQFNAWAKYDNFTLDAKIPSVLERITRIPQVNALYNGSCITLEGGAIDYNGAGVLVTTEECLMDTKVQVRNPGFKKKDYEKAFKEYLGINEVIWLGKGIAGDDTHGHVDDLCRFVSEDTVVLVSEENPKDENYKPLKQNAERLEGHMFKNGKKLQVVKLPMPTRIDFEDLRLPASYANFYISNNAVLVPTFNDVNDRIALGILAELFSDRKVVGIHALDLVWGLGTIHCLSHEIPL